MIILVLERHADPTGSINVLFQKIRMDRKLDHNNCVNYDRSLDWQHPEEQIQQLKVISKKYNYPPSVKHVVGEYLHATISTYSLIPVYFFNNLLAQDPHFNIEAFEVVPPSGKRPAHVKSAMKGRWIDESIIGHVYDKLYNEANKAAAKRKKK